MKASLAQWQSTGLVNQGSRVQSSQEAMLNFYIHFSLSILVKVAWPSGLRRWFKAPVSSEAWVRIPPLPNKLLLKIKVS